MRLFSLAAALLAMISLAACGSGTSDNTTQTGLAGTGTNPVLIPVNVPTPAVMPQDGTGTGMTSRELAFASYLFEKVNEYRTTVAIPALPALAWDVNVAGTASTHTRDQQMKGIMSHDGPGNCAFPQNCLALRLQNDAILYVSAGENIGRGFANPDDLLRAWIASPTHKDILDDPNWTRMGIGYFEGASPVNAAMTGPWVTLNCIQR
jgi:uncharacterized protein YkwD